MDGLPASSLNLSTTQLIEGDCLDVLRELPEACADLAYLDPPFNTGETKRAANASYHDRWPGAQAYVRFLSPRIGDVRRALKPTGSILVHCDWRTSHHVRLLLDSIFGEGQFVNHLIWSYGLGGSSPRRFARKHDDILFYGKTGDYWFDPPMVPARSARMRGQLKKATDVIEIPAINNMAAERVGYPTQKPLVLLELLIEACCRPGGLVLDPFCGSGTALVAAARTGRRYVGIDVNPQAIALARERLAREADKQCR